MCWRNLTTALAFLALAIGVEAMAEEPPMEEHRCEQMKINTEDAGVVPVNEWEVVLSFSHTRARHAWPNSGGTESRGGNTYETAAGLSLVTGLRPNLDIGLDLGYLTVHDRTSDPKAQTALSDLGTRVKWLFFEDEEEMLAASLVLGLTVPLDRSRDARALGTTQDFFSFDPALVVTKDWSSRLTTTADLAYSLPFGKDREDARGTLTADVAVGYQVLRWLQPEVEFNYAHDFVKDASGADGYYVTGGFIVTLADHIFLTTGVQQAVAGRNVDKTTACLIGLKWCP